MTTRARRPMTGGMAVVCALLDAAALRLDLGAAAGRQALIRRADCHWHPGHVEHTPLLEHVLGRPVSRDCVGDRHLSAWDTSAVPVNFEAFPKSDTPTLKRWANTPT